jgi:uncharacterized protein
MILPITLVIAAAAGLINLWLAIRASMVRVKGKVLFGDGGNPQMLQRMRAHANFAEYAPAILILMALIEFARGSTIWLWAAGAVFILVRLAHVIGMDQSGPNPFRLVGAVGTWVVLLGLSLWALAIGYQSAEAPGRPTTVEVGAPKA